MEVAEFNVLSAADARTLVNGCLGVPRWVDEVVAARSPAGENLLVSAPMVTPKDTTGAGDSLAAGLLAELVRRGPHE